MSIYKKLVLLGVALVVITGIVVVVLIHAPQVKQAPSNLNASDDTLLQMLHKAPATPQSHMASQQPLPTNKWFSSLAFDQKNPIFAYPLSYKLTVNGFETGYSRPQATADTVAAPHVGDVSVAFNRPVSAAIDAFDDLSVRTQFAYNNTRIGDARVTQGSPFIFVHVESGQSATVTSTTSTPTMFGTTTATFKQGAKQYAVTAPGGLNIDGKVVKPSNDFAVYIVPDGANLNTYVSAASNPISRTSVSYAQKDGQLTTAYSIYTTNNKETIWGTLPTQHIVNTKAIGVLPSLAGQLTFVQSTTFTGSQGLNTPRTELPVGNLSGEQLQTLKSTLSSEASNIQFTKDDTYYAGKELYRAANLLMLAKQLNMTTEADKIQSAMLPELNTWLDPNTYKHQASKYFYYDTAYGGIVGVTPAFGSDQFNDHHFHYGYMIYAASVVAQYNQNFLDQHRQMVDLLVRDIASPVKDENFPRLRTFDLYMGHSWASGQSPFADGNNQESSSEAVLAWDGIYRWGQATKRNDISSLGSWLYTRESDAAVHQYLGPDTTQASYKGYTHPFVSLVWGGKLDYATWFSPDPAAKLAIQLIPLSPAHNYAINDSAQVTRNAQTVGSQPTLFKDYIAMYQAKIDQSKAINTIQNLAAADFDGANSRTYALAWAMTAH